MSSGAPIAPQKNPQSRVVFGLAKWLDRLSKGLYRLAFALDPAFYEPRAESRSLAPFTAPKSCLTPGCIHMRGHVGLCVKAEEIKG